MNAVTRPALRYLGGKWRLAPRIIALFPEHVRYVEPFGGAMSVLLRKPRVGPEVYNDLDGEVVNLFHVLRDDVKSARLVDLITLTPFSREEWELAYSPTEDTVERARRMIVRSYMGYGSSAAKLSRTTGFRGDQDRAYSTPTTDWVRFPPALAAIAARVQMGVTIENRPALEIIRRFDRPDTLIYADPPYVHSTRSPRRNAGQLQHSYSTEMDDGDHADLLEVLVRCSGMVVLSGYANPLYDAALRGWRRVEIAARGDGAVPRTEIVWLNPLASERLA